MNTRDAETHAREDAEVSEVAEAAEPRRTVLAQCRVAEAAWQQQPGRTLMLFLDGTGNMLGVNADTNVVKLFRAVDKSAAARQTALQPCQVHLSGLAGQRDPETCLRPASAARPDWP